MIRRDMAELAMLVLLNCIPFLVRHTLSCLRSLALGGAALQALGTNGHSLSAKNSFTLLTGSAWLAIH
jgi:hypothetical protein